MLIYKWRTPWRAGSNHYFLGLRWRQAASKFGDQGFPGDTHDPPTAAHLVQARLQLNQGVDANLRSLGINISI